MQGIFSCTSSTCCIIQVRGSTPVTAGRCTILGKHSKLLSEEVYALASCLAHVTRTVMFRTSSKRVLGFFCEVLTADALLYIKIIYS